MDNCYLINFSQQHYNNTNSVFNKFRTYKVAEKPDYEKLSNPAKTEDNKENPSKKISDKFALTAIIIGGSLLFLSKGVQRYTRKTLNNVKDYLEAKSDAQFLKTADKKSSFYEYSVRKINSFLRKSESINNINSVKDILFMKAMYCTKPTKKIHQFITGFFERLSVNSVKSSYKKTKKNFDKMDQTFDALDDYIIKNSGDEIVEFGETKTTKKELVQKAKKCRETVQLVVNALISDDTQKHRYEFIKDSLSLLHSRLWDKSFKGFWTKDNKFKRKEMWQTFIASEQIKGNKTDLAEKVAFARNTLSYNDKEKSGYVSKYVKNLSSIIFPDDEQGVDIVKRLEWISKNSECLKQSKEVFLSELDKLDKYKIRLSDDENIAKIQLKDKTTNIRLIRNIVTDSATGELQDMFDIYHKIAPFELVKSGAFASAKKAVKSFDKSVNLEIGEFFDKARDLELGSAPTDVLTILSSCGMISYGLVKAKDKNEQTSVMLKSGIPVIGALGTSLLSATKLVSGSKSIALGLVSGLCLNQIGRYAESLKNKPHQGFVK